MKTNRTWPFPLLFLLALAMPGCQPDPDDRNRGAADPTLSTISDSAGIRIVENARPPEGSRLWRVGAEPSVTIGEVEGEEPYMLSGIWDAMKLADGRIFIPNSGSNELRVFDAGSGVHLATWGRSGEGPGEFNYVREVERWPGDSIAAWYGPRRGVSIFDSEGNFGREIALERDPDDPGSVMVQPAAITRDGAILAGVDPHMDDDDVPLEIRDADGRLVSSLGRHPTYMVLIDGMLYPRILGWTVVQEPWGDLVIHSKADRYEIKAFARDGTIARIVRRDHESRAPTQAEIDAWIEEQVYVPPEMLTSEIEAEQESERRRYGKYPVVEHIPAYASIVIDRLDHLWVEEYEVPGARRPGVLWTVFDPEGRALGYVETPEGLVIHEIGEDYILGHVYDELHVEYVQVWDLER
ncbi:MAG: hypothetical protein OXQ93_12425 [Gemmatimonadota bacterium]|nr:hypothetical protein [bacterium]MDE2876238.1 hypothetical protein [Gemmatimonadota bacterium]